MQSYRSRVGSAKEARCSPMNPHGLEIEEEESIFGILEALGFVI
jgi:hypothetical protein